MALFLNIAGSACMVVFLLLLVWRGLWQLGWLPRCLRCPFAAQEPADAQTAQVAGEAPVRATPTNDTYTKQAPKSDTWVASQPTASCSAAEGAFWFFAAIFLSWLFVWVGFQCSGYQNYSDFLPYFYQRFTTAGDAEHYQYLAENWYASAGDSINLIVFYPLYPLCLKLLRVLTLGDTLLAGVVFSQLCWGASAVAMRRLAGRFYGTTAAQITTLSMLLFPFGFFALGVYTESLFLLLTILTLDAIATKRFTRAGVLGCLAALCRTQGVLLILAAVYAFLQAYRHPDRAACKAWRKALPLALIPLGYLVYLGLNWFYCGAPFAFLYYQSIAPWYQHADWIGNNLAQQWGMAVAYPGLSKYIYFPQIALYFVAMALLLYGVLCGASMPLLLYGGAYIGASYLSSWLISGSRYVFGCAAIYLIIGRIKQRYIQLLLLSVEAAFLVYYACCYMQGQAIM